MKLHLLLFFSLIAGILTSCFKDEPLKETYQLAGSWKVSTVKISYYDASGTVSSTLTYNDMGFLMLSFTDDFSFLNGYSYSLNSSVLTANSAIYNYFYTGNCWGVTQDKKAFNITQLDASTGFSTYLASLTITKSTKKKLTLQYVELSNVTGSITKTEEWEMERSTH